MLHFNLDQIAAFIAVAQAGSFSGAARQLNKSRATLHQQVSNLEIDFNLKLFDRVGKGLRLTPDGEKLLTQAKHMVYQAEYLQNCADSLAKEEESVLTVYHDGILPLEIMASADRWVRDAFPLVNIHWLYRRRSEMYQALQDGSADLGLALSATNTLPEHGVDFFNLGGIDLKVYVNRHSKLLAHQPCSVKDFLSHRRLLLDSYQGTTIQSRTALSINEAVVSNIDMLLALLVQDGWSILPSKWVEGSNYSQHLVAVDVDFKTSPESHDYILFSNQLTTAGPALSLLIESLKAQFHDYIIER